MSGNVYASVQRIFVRFCDIANRDNIDRLMSFTYNGEIENLDILFTDAERTTLKSNTQLNQDLRRTIIDELIIPEATETNDDDHIRILFNSAPLRIHLTNGPKQTDTMVRLTATTLKEALTTAEKYKHNKITVSIDVGPIHFDPRIPVLNVRNWNGMSTQPYSVSAPPTPSITSTPTVKPDPDVSKTIAEDIGKAITTAFSSLSFNKQQSPTPISASLRLFNSANLDPDVKARYDHKLAKGLILGRSIVPFSSTGHYFAQDGSDRIILADGSLFYHVDDPDIKNLHRSPPKCTDPTFSGVRQWYQTFQQHVVDYGIYCHPMWCFRANHGGNWGFTCDGRADSDLPITMQAPCTRMTGEIYKLLTSSDMFPKGSSYASIISNCYGDGYWALKQILLKVHPLFHEQPATLIKNYPMQKTLPLAKYYQIFRDYLQLRAFINNIDSSLDDDSELDIFIANSAHPRYLNRVTRDERRQSSLQHKYRGDQLLETIQKHLTAPDSPATGPVLRPRTPRPPYMQSASRASPRPTPVNPVTWMHPDQSPSNKFAPVLPDSPSTSPPSSSPPAESTDLIAALDDITPPHEHRELFHVYSAQVFQTQREPNRAFSSPCLVCSGSHRFTDCPILNDTEFLRQHYIRWCQQLKQDQRARQRHRPDDTPSTSRVHFIESNDSSLPLAESSDTDYGPDDQQSVDSSSSADFFTGRA